MYIMENGKKRKMTHEEILLRKEWTKRQTELDKNRPPTLEEEIESLKQCILEISTVVYK